MAVRIRMAIFGSGADNRSGRIAAWIFRPDVGGGAAAVLRAVSSDGRATGLHPVGRRFDSVTAHQTGAGRGSGSAPQVRTAGWTFRGGSALSRRNRGEEARQRCQKTAGNGKLAYISFCKMKDISRKKKEIRLKYTNAQVILPGSDEGSSARREQAGMQRRTSLISGGRRQGPDRTFRDRAFRDRAWFHAPRSARAGPHKRTHVAGGPRVLL